MSRKYYKDLYDKYEEFMYVPPNSPRDPNVCDECEGDMQQTSDGFLACTICGVCDLDSMEYVQESFTDVIIKNKTLYKRRQYCINKLQLLAAVRHCRSPAYMNATTILKNLNFDNINELRTLMRENKLSNYYKYLYVIWNDIKHEKLITLTDNEIQAIATKFIELENKFKTSEYHKRKNIFSYNSVIYIIMKDMNMNGYEHIILPNNHEQLEEVIQKINV